MLHLKRVANLYENINMLNANSRDIETLAMKKQLKRVITSNNQIEVNKKKIYKKKKKLFATKK